MAKQRGIIKLDGTIADITFYKTSDGYLAKEKSAVSASRIATDPAFARTRENGAEFAHAGRAGKMLRTAFRTQLQSAGDKRMVGRLTQALMEVVHSDTTSLRGARNVMAGQLSLVQGFEFNNNGQLGTTLFAPYTATINRTTGDASVSLPAFAPAHMIAAPTGTTHFQLSATAAEVDFATGVYTVDEATSTQLPWDATPTALIALECALPAASVLPQFLALGVAFFQEVNGLMYPLNNGAFNALGLVRVDQV